MEVMVMAETPQELFEHDVQDLYDAEQKLVRALERMAKKATDRELKKGFAAHAKTTQRQARRLEQVFRTIGRKPKRHTCAGINGLIEEYASFVRDEKPSEEVLDVFSVAAALKVEHYEIVAYNDLAKLAQQLGNETAASLLQETLEEEQETAHLLEGLSERLGAAMMAASSDEGEEE
jgi:ferritin-like metal-binding protein YciE